MNKNDWAKIRESIEKGVYKMVRLIRVYDNGKTEVIAPYNRKTGKEALERFDYLQMKSSTLCAGNYEVQCKIGANANSITDSYKLSIKERRMINIPINSDDNIQDKTNEQSTMENISLDDHIELIKECAMLKANVQVLERDVAFYKHEMANLQTQLINKGLSDNQGQGEDKNVMATMLNDAMPSLINGFDKLLNVLDKREDTKQMQLSSGHVKKIGMPKKRQTIEDIANDYADLLEPLMESDPDKFNTELDTLEQEQPDVYDIVCELLELEEEEEEEGGKDAN